MFDQFEMDYLKLKFRGKRQELAEKANVSYNTVCNFFKGDNHNVEVARVIIQILSEEKQPDPLILLQKTIERKRATA